MSPVPYGSALGAERSGRERSGRGRAACGRGGPGRARDLGYLAGCLRMLVAEPQSWWDRVRFDPDHPVHIAVTAPSPGCAAWLLVLPPGYRGDVPDWEVACLVAGEMAEQVSTSRPPGPPGTSGPSSGWQTRPLSPGRTRVRGGAGPYRVINTGGGYAVSLHARSAGPVVAGLPVSGLNDLGLRRPA